MSSAAIDADDIATPATRGQVWAWGLWDWGSASYNAVTLTFVFSVYLTDVVGEDLPGDTSPNTYFSWALAAAGLVVAVLAPVTGQRADAGGRRKLTLAIWTGLTVLSTAGLFLVRDEYSYLWLGLVLIALGSIFFEFASVSYNAMLRQVSTPATIGRISGFGWAMGYFGGIVLLLIVYIGLIAGDGDARGLLGVSTDGGLNIRLVAIVAAVWFVVFALPVLFKIPEIPGLAAEKRLSLAASYKKLFADVRDLYRADRHVVFFLGASAIFRDGLTGIFSFGAVLAVTVYDISAGDVLIFGIAANVTSAIGALVGGRLDDRIGPKAVVVGSLVALLISGTILAFLSGPTAFWIFGLLLTLFVGPAQASSRTYLARLTIPGREGQMFGLYATTGRAVSFLAPSLFGLFIAIFDTDRAGIFGILLVLAVGTALMLPVRAPAAESAPTR